MKTNKLHLHKIVFNTYYFIIEKWMMILLLNYNFSIEIGIFNCELQ